MVKVTPAAKDVVFAAACEAKPPGEGLNGKYRSEAQAQVKSL